MKRAVERETEIQRHGETGGEHRRRERGAWWWTPREERRGEKQRQREWVGAAPLHPEQLAEGVT